MAKKINAMVKLQVPAGAATPAPPVGTAGPRTLGAAVVLSPSPETGGRTSARLIVYGDAARSAYGLAKIELKTLADDRRPGGSR